MVLFRSTQKPPAWCELTGFEIITMGPNDTADFSAGPMKRRFVAVDGPANVVTASGSQVIRDGQFWDAEEGAAASLRTQDLPSRLVCFTGAWGSHLGGCGTFTVAGAGTPGDGGDPVTYAKSTSFDSHYHDCDEYWVILDGSGEVVVGDEHLTVRAGDCVATAMGVHHDFPNVDSPIVAVYFETTLRGRKRIGHLWEHRHGPAEPGMEQPS
jgi:mannose-6-phosphate isomerase-like protein (cupin superfamily)